MSFRPWPVPFDPRPVPFDPSPPSPTVDAFTGLATWVANEGACEKCEGLDGEVMSAFLDVEDVAHPNCQCTLEPIEKTEPAGAFDLPPTL